MRVFFVVALTNKEKVKEAVRAADPSGIRAEEMTAGS